MFIEDGTGSGVSVKVNHENQLTTNAITIEEILHTTIDHGDSYTVFLESTPTYKDESDTGDLCAFYLKNTSEKKIIISQIGVWTESSRYVEPTINVEGIPTNTEILTPTNMNLSSGNTASGLFYTGNSIYGISGGTRIARFRIPANSSTNFNSLNSKIIIPKNNILTMYVSEPDKKIELTFNFYYH
ncbi:MAG: hypothetical protein KAH05_04570 [Clostridiales bacterium]|nr:hypothetical protein [Clostridiales bacterium]